jgi:ADP-heptose:LPS heptosyltransferase
LPLHPERILVVRTDRLGDVVLTVPVLSALRRCFPRARISVLLQHYTGAIVAGNPFVDEILWYDSDGASVPFHRMLAALKERRFDAAVLVRPDPRAALLLFLARIPVRIGTGYRYYSPLLTHRIYDHRSRAELHELEYNLRLLAPLGCDVREELESPRFGMSSAGEAAASAEETLESLGVRSERRIVVHPGSGGSAADWPVESFAALAGRLEHARHGIILVTGTEAEAAKAEAVVRGCTHAVNLAGRLSIPQLAAVIRSSRLFVGNSSGPLHVAVAVGTPVLGFYPSVPVMGQKRWGPYTAKSIVLSPDPARCVRPAEHSEGRCACMDTITVDEACRSAEDLLRRYPARLGEEKQHA